MTSALSNKSNITHTHAQLHDQNTDNTLLTPDKTKTVVSTDNASNLHIYGNIIQSGSTWDTHANNIYTTGNTITLRDGAISGLPNGQYVGFIAKKYDGVNDGVLVYDNDGVARVGDMDTVLWTGTTQPLATREEIPLNNGLATWNQANNRFETITKESLPLSTLTQTALDSKVGTGTTVNGHTLNTNITVLANETGAYTSGQTDALLLTKSGTGHTHSYLPLSGGTLTGDLSGTTYYGSGSGLTNIPASSVVGLNLDRITSASNSAIMGSTGLTVNTGMTVSGKVGIGTTTPAQQLEVNGIVRFQKYFESYDSTTLAGKFGSANWLTTPGGTIDTALTAVQNIYLAPGNTTTPKYVFKNTSMGINVMSPVERLEVSGNTKVYGDITGSTFYGNGTGLTNIGNVTGATSSISDNLVSFNGASGKIIKDSGITTANLSGLTSNVQSQLDLSGFKLKTTVYNNTGSIITKGSAVKIQSSYNGTSSISLAISSGSGNQQVAGVVENDISISSYGTIINGGVLSGLTVNSFNIGDIIYLSDKVAGSYVSSTSSLNFKSRSNQIGYIINTGTTTGSIYVDINNEDLNLSLTDIQRNILEGNVISTGIYEYTGLTKTSSTTFNISPAKGWIVTNTYVNSTIPSINHVIYSGTTNTTTPYLATSDSTYIMLNSGSTITMLSTFPTPQQRRENIFLGKVAHPDHTSILNINNTVDFDVSPLSVIRDLFSPMKLINDGITIYPNGTNLNFNLSSGDLYGMGINWVVNQLNPDQVNIASQIPVSFFYRTRLGGNTGLVSLIDPTRYDNNGVITTLPGNNNQSTNQRVYLYPTGVINIQYGQQLYSSLALALAGQQTENFVKCPNVMSGAILIGIIAVRKGATQLSDITHGVFVPASMFGESVGGVNGISTTTLQQAYDNSITPEIITDSTLGALTLKRGSSSDSDSVFEIMNGSGVITASIDGNGIISGSTFATNSTTVVNNLNADLLDGIHGSGFTKSVMTNVGDIIVGTTGGAAQRLPIGSPNTVLHGSLTYPTYSSVVEDDIVLSAGNSTNNATTTKHGFLPVLSDNSSQYLNGQGNWSIPSGVVNSYTSTSFTTQTGVTVTHSFGTYPVVMVVNSTGAVIIPLSITHTSVNAFTVVFSSSTTGTIITSVGSPQASAVLITAANYVAVSSDKHIQVTSPSKTITLLTAVGKSGFELYIDNASTGNITVNTTSSQTIHGQLTQTVPSNSTLAVYSDGTNWRIF